MTRKQNTIITVELEFSWFSSSSFIENRAFKINHNNDNWNVLPYSTTKMPISILIEKKAIFIFPRIYYELSRSLHGVTTHVKAPGLQTTELKNPWRKS